MNADDTDTSPHVLAVLRPGDVLVTADGVFLVVTGQVDCYTDGGYRATGKLMAITSDQANDMHEYEGAQVFETTMGFVGLWRQA